MGLFAKGSKFKLVLLQFNQVFIMHVSEMAINKDRYFSGHTKNPDGSVQFRAGKTKLSTAIDGAIKIVTVAVRALTGLPEHALSI